MIKLKGSAFAVAAAVLALVASSSVVMTTPTTAGADEFSPTYFTHPDIQGPGAITSGPDGALWFTNGVTRHCQGPFTCGEVIDVPGSSIGRITTAGAFTKFANGGITAARGIVTGPDGNLWFTNGYGVSTVGNPQAGWFGSSIGRMTPAGVVTIFTDPGVVSPYGITAGPDGNLWFTNAQSNSIGRITTAGVITVFPNAGVNGPVGIAAGPDGNLWFTNQIGNSIGRITTAGVITIFTDPAINTPVGIAAGPDGNLWFANQGPRPQDQPGGDSFGRITTAGVVTTFPTINGPTWIAAGPDGYLWFTNSDFVMGRVSTAGVTEVTPCLGIPIPMGITAGSDGNMWFANYGGNGYGGPSIARYTTGAEPLADRPCRGILAITTGDLPDAAIGVPYSATLSATGPPGPYRWGKSGRLPKGLKLNAATGVISGTPTRAETGTLTLKVRSQSQSTMQSGYTLAVVAPDLDVTTASLPGATLGQPYSTVLGATGGTAPYRWKKVGGTLPQGLKVRPTGVISGTPMTSGTSTFTVRVTDKSRPQRTDTRTYTLTV